MYLEYNIGMPIWDEKDHKAFGKELLSENVDLKKLGLLIGFDGYQMFHRCGV